MSDWCNTCEFVVYEGRCECTPSPGSLVIEHHENGKLKCIGMLTNTVEKTGWWRYWHDNGQKAIEGEYSHNEKCSKWTAWYANGQKQQEGYYVTGRKIGRWTHWHDNGQKWSEGEWSGWERNEKQGVWTYWHEDGEKAFEDKYRKLVYTGVIGGWKDVTQYE